MSEPWSKYDVWRTYNPDKRFQRWQRIMRRAARFSRLPNGQGFLEIDGQRTFRCEFCEEYAAYADYETLQFFCFKHAVWYLEINGMTPCFNGRVRDSV